MWYILLHNLQTKYPAKINSNLLFCTSFSGEKVEYSAGFAPSKLVSGLYQAFVFRVIFQVGHLVGLFVIETGILSIAWNDDVGPIPTTL